MAKPVDSPAMPADTAKGQHGDYLSTRWSHTAKFLRELTSRKAALAEEIRRKRAAIQVFGEEEREALIASPFTVSAYLYKPDGAVQQTSASLPLLQTMPVSAMTGPKSPVGKPTEAKPNTPLATPVSAPSPSLDLLLQSVLQRSTAVSTKLVKSCALSKEAGGADNKSDVRGNNPGIKKGNINHTRSFGNLMAKSRQSRRQRSQNTRNSEEEDERSTTPESHVSQVSASRNSTLEGVLPDFAPAGQPQLQATEDPAPREMASRSGDEQGRPAGPATQEPAAPEGVRRISSGSRFYGSRRFMQRGRRTPSRSMDGDQRKSLPGSTAPRSTSDGTRSAADCSDQQAASDSAGRSLHLPRLGQGVGGKAAALPGADRDTVGGVEASSGKSGSHSACDSNASSGTDTGGDRDTSRRTTPASRASCRSSNVFTLPPSGRSPWAKSTTARDLVFITRF